MAFLERTARHASGFVVITDNESGRVLSEGETLMCMHCQMHWIMQPGSGKKRGWCFRCNGPTCGKAPCEAGCVHFERALELFERGILLDRNIERIKAL